MPKADELIINEWPALVIGEPVIGMRRQSKTFIVRHESSKHVRRVVFGEEK